MGNKLREDRNKDSFWEYKHPIIVIVTKADVWSEFAPGLSYGDEVWTKDPKTNSLVLSEKRIKEIEKSIQQLQAELAEAREVLNR